MPCAPERTKKQEHVAGGAQAQPKVLAVARNEGQFRPEGRNAIPTGRQEQKTPFSPRGARTYPSSPQRRRHPNLRPGGEAIVLRSLALNLEGKPHHSRFLAPNLPDRIQGNGATQPRPQERILPRSRKPSRPLPEEAHLVPVAESAAVTRPRRIVSSPARAGYAFLPGRTKTTAIIVIFRPLSSGTYTTFPAAENDASRAVAGDCAVRGQRNPARCLRRNWPSADSTLSLESATLAGQSYARKPIHRDDRAA